MDALTGTGDAFIGVDTHVGGIAMATNFSSADIGDFHSSPFRIIFWKPC
jgi:hypothetical protein